MSRALIQHAVEELRRSPAGPAGLVAVVIVLVWSARDGGTDPLVWAPGALMLAGLVLVVAVAAPGVMPGGRPARVALAAFAAFVGWCFLSISWADVRADAWSGAGQTLGYFAVFCLFATRSWSGRAAGTVLGSYSVGVASIGVWKLVTIADEASPTRGFIEGRLAEPISYPNANCALYVGAAIPALLLATRRETPILLRGLFLASAGVLAELALLCQSRASLVAIPIVLLAVFALVRGRLRSLLGCGLVFGVVALSAPRLLDVYSAVVGGNEIRATVVEAQRTVLVAALSLGLVGIGWGYLDRRLELSTNVRRLAAVAATLLVVVGAAGSAALFADRYGNPFEQVSIWWGRFKADEYVYEAETPHLVSGFGGSGRYEIWRVGLGLFKEHPLTGIGVDNFGVDWLRERPNNQDLIYPHSIEIRLLQQTGIVGSALVLVFLAAAWLAVWRALVRREPAFQVVAASGLLVAVYWLAHGSVDWLWEIPALSGAAFGALGLAVGLSPRQASRPRPRLAAALAGALATLAVVAVLPLWLSAREVERAVASSSASDGPYGHLDRARRLNPFSDEPDVVGAVIAAQRGEVERQRAFLERALERNRFNWYPYLELGLIEARAGNRASSLAWLAQAVALNPRDRTVQFVADRITDGKPPSQAEVDELYVRSADRLTGVDQGD